MCMIHELVVLLVHAFGFWRTGSVLPHVIAGLISIALSEIICGLYERPIERRLRSRFGQRRSLIAMGAAPVLAAGMPAADGVAEHRGAAEA